MAEITPSAKARILSIVPSELPVDECWPWKGKLDRYGYGRVSWCGEDRVHHQTAHRATYRLLVGEVPDGLVVDHLCRNRACVNPTHLEPVTNGENTRRGNTGQHLRGPRRANPGWCANGHHLIEHGRIDRRGLIVCRECARQRRKRYDERRGGT